MSRRALVVILAVAVVAAALWWKRDVVGPALAERVPALAPYVAVCLLRPAQPERGCPHLSISRRLRTLVTTVTPRHHRAAVQPIELSLRLKYP